MRPLNRQQIDILISISEGLIDISQSAELLRAADLIELGYGVGMTVDEHKKFQKGLMEAIGTLGDFLHRRETSAEKSVDTMARVGIEIKELSKEEFFEMFPMNRQPGEEKEQCDCTSPYAHYADEHED